MIMMVAKTILMVTKTIKMMVDKTIKKQALCCRNVLAPLVSLIFRNYSVQCSLRPSRSKRFAAEISITEL